MQSNSQIAVPLPSRPRLVPTPATSLLISRIRAQEYPRLSCQICSSRFQEKMTPLPDRVRGWASVCWLRKAWHGNLEVTYSAYDPMSQDQRKDPNSRCVFL